MDHERREGTPRTTSGNDQPFSSGSFERVLVKRRGDEDALAGLIGEYGAYVSAVVRGIVAPG
jgi:hypothetical protein